MHDGFGFIVQTNQMKSGMAAQGPAHRLIVDPVERATISARLALAIDFNHVYARLPKPHQQGFEGTALIDTIDVVLFRTDENNGASDVAKGRRGGSPPLAFTPNSEGGETDKRQTDKDD